jgi:hypothetical protein
MGETIAVKKMLLCSINVSLLEQFLAFRFSQRVAVSCPVEFPGGNPIQKGKFVSGIVERLWTKPKSDTESFQPGYLSKHPKSNACGFYNENMITTDIRQTKRAA